ncbi:MAG TPA: isocitrate lyase/phosphoenolpyruvate mutase family protein [Gemmataceae bacterium]|nr:isocitrate lyase/phosphoenolpyruvate mutase family protein [Gemmataceae bacterium]
MAQIRSSSRSNGRRPTWKELIAVPAPLLLPSAHDALTARLIERASFKEYQVGGFSLAAARYGVPDIDLTHFGEKAPVIQQIIGASSLPVLVDADELQRLNGKENNVVPPSVVSVAIGRHSIEVPSEYISVVGEFRDRGEEEKRQLVVQFFYQVLGYKRARVRSEHKHNDVRVHDRRDQPWLVVEVKPLLEAEREKRAARRQGFDYAHRLGMRFVVISDDDYYEVFDRCAGQRLRYDEMRQGAFQLTALRLRDADLLSMLAAER